MQHPEILQVVVGIADHTIEDHLAIQQFRIRLRIAAVFANHTQKVRIAHLVEPFRLQQGLKTDHVPPPPLSSMSQTISPTRRDSFFVLSQTRIL